MGGAEVNERQKSAIDAMNRNIEKLQALVDDVIPSPQQLKPLQQHLHLCIVSCPARYLIQPRFVLKK